MSSGDGQTASLVEVFSSAQGEGPEVGRTTVFVRFGGCDLRCRWCDSPGTWRPVDEARFETDPGSETFETLPNPVDVDDLAERIDAFAPTARAWISLTGGEPLLQAAAVERLARTLSGRGRRIYLETHGLHAEALERCVDSIDLVSMDWKLASDVQPGPGVARPPGLDFHDAHERFLRVAQRAGAVYVKAVLTPSTREDELDAMPGPDRLLACLARAETVLDDVRLIPQTHPLYGVL